MARTPRDDDQLHSSPAFAKALGRTIKVIRTDLGIERRTLAREAGISYSYLTEIENGNKPPSSSVLGPIASALGVRMSKLIQGAEDRVDSLELEQERSALYERSGPRGGSVLQGRAALWEGQSLPSSPASQPAPGPEESPPILDRFELQLRASPRQYAMRPSFRALTATSARRSWSSKRSSLLCRRKTWSGFWTLPGGRQGRS